MHSIVTTFRGAVIKVEVANFCAAMDTLIDQDAPTLKGAPLSADYARLVGTQFHRTMNMMPKNIGFRNG